MAQFRRRCTRKVRDLLHTLFKRLGVQAPQLVESFLERGKVDKCAALIHLLLLVLYVSALGGQRLQCREMADQKGACTWLNAQEKADQYGDAEHLDIARKRAHFPRFEYRAENCDDIAGRFPDKIERTDILLQARTQLPDLLSSRRLLENSFALPVQNRDVLFAPRRGQLRVFLVKLDP